MAITTTDFIIKQANQYINNIKIKAELEKINMKLQSIENKVDNIEFKLDENHLISLRKGLGYLSNSLNTDSIQIRQKELDLAHQEFSHLTNLNPNLYTHDIPNSELICLGYFGNFVYFYLIKDSRNALIQAYECVKSYPEIGIKTFSSEFFSMDYESIINSLDRRISENKKKARKIPFKGDFDRLICNVVLAPLDLLAPFFGTDPVTNWKNNDINMKKYIKEYRDLKFNIDQDLNEKKINFKRLKKECETNLEQLYKFQLEEIIKRAA